MKTSKSKLHSILAYLIFILLPHTTFAAIISTEVNVDAFYNSKIISVNGLNQFDPSLGTLTDVRFNLNNTYHVRLSLTDTIPLGIDFGYSQFLSANLAFRISLEIETPSNARLSLVSTDFLSGILNLNNVAEIGPSSHVVSESVTTRLQNKNYFNDFIGTGTIDYMELGMLPNSATIFYLFGNPKFPDVFNISSKTRLEALSLGPATISINYTYSPVPIPAAVWLFCAGIVGLFGLNRR